MTEIFSAPWFWWAIAIAVALPISLVVLTEVHNALLRRNSYLARPVSLVRNYVLPLAALLLLLLKATEVRADATTVRVVATVLGFVVLVLLLSGLNATVFQGAPEGSWRTPSMGTASTVRTTATATQAAATGGACSPPGHQATPSDCCWT